MSFTRRGFLKSMGAAAVSAAATPVLAADEKGYADAMRKEAGLGGYWRMAGSLKDELGKADGEPKGGDAKFGDGPTGRALVLSQGRYLTLGPTPHLDSDEATLELLFRLDAMPREGYNPCIAAKRSSSPQTRWSIHIVRDTGKLAFWNGAGVVTIDPPGGPIKAGDWHHLAIAMGKNNLKVYLDGVAAEIPQVLGLADERKQLPIQIGASSPGGDEKLDAAIAEVAIYTRMLPAEAVAAHVDAAGWAERRQKLQQEVDRKREEQRRLAEEQAKQRQAKLQQRLNDPRLMERGQPRVYRGNNLTAISFGLGGIGAGSIQMNGKAERAIWQIFGNFNHATVPDSFMAVRVRAGGGGDPVVRALQTSVVGRFMPMGDLSFRGEYPFAWYDFEDPKLPVKISLECFTPLVPLDAKSSAIPCAIFNATVENTTATDVEVSFLAVQQNAAGFDGSGAILNREHPGYGGNRNRIVREGGATLLHMTGGADPKAPAFGDLALVALSPDASGSAACESLNVLFEQFAADGAVAGREEAGPSTRGETLNGALAVPMRLAPGEKRTVSFILCWHFPNARNGGEIAGWQHDGNMYANWWKDALDVARFVAQAVQKLTEQTRLYHASLYESNLPHWFLDRISSQVAVLRSKTCFWGRDGYFGGWEGCSPGSGCCAGSCTHVWHYAQAHARLFPELARKMREETYGYQRPDGGLPHRHPSFDPAVDGQLGDILGAWREHLTGTDQKWLETLWPKVKKAMDYIVAKHDEDEDGVLAGAQWNTLDGALGGSTSWMGTLYLAALEACERMGALAKDQQAVERYAKIRRSGAAKQDQTLWNGEYYIQKRDPEPRQDYGEGCSIDQLLGEWWANQVNLRPNYPPDRVKTALGSLLKYNFRADFKGVPQSPRKFVADEDAGLQMIQWPKGPRPNPTILYGDEVMTGFEYAAAATMLQYGMLKEGLMVVQAIAERYDGRLREHLTGGGTSSWGYSGNPFGDDECGKYYARAMSAWSLLLAIQGFSYDGPAGEIGFRPVWKPEDHASFFTAAMGWGVFTQKRNGANQRERIELRSGRLDVKTMLFESSAPASTVKVTLGGKAIESRFEQEGPRVTVRLARPLTIEAGQAIVVDIA